MSLFADFSWVFLTDTKLIKTNAFTFSPFKICPDAYASSAGADPWYQMYTSKYRSKNIKCMPTAQTEVSPRRWRESKAQLSPSRLSVQITGKLQEGTTCSPERCELLGGHGGGRCFFFFYKPDHFTIFCRLWELCSELPCGFVITGRRQRGKGERNKLQSDEREGEVQVAPKRRRKMNVLFTDCVLRGRCANSLFLCLCSYSSPRK